MSVMKDLEATCIHTITSEINCYSSTEKIHITFHLSNCLVEINLNNTNHFMRGTWLQLFKVLKLDFKHWLLLFLPSDKVVQNVHSDPLLQLAELPQCRKCLNELPGIIVSLTSLYCSNIMCLRHSNKKHTVIPVGGWVMSKYFHT